MPRETLKLIVTAALGLVACRCAPAEVLDKVKNAGGIAVHYKLILPNGYDPSKAYPAVLAFPGGPQTMQVVQGTVDHNWRAQAEQRGYIVVVPAAPDGELFFEEGARVFPEFITDLLSDFKVDGGKFHIAGMSNGGLSAFYIASLYTAVFFVGDRFSRPAERCYRRKTESAGWDVHQHACRRVGPGMAERDEAAIRGTSFSWLQGTIHD